MKLLHPTQMTLQADYARSRWFLKAPVGTTVSDLMSPPFWAHHVGKLRRHDLIEAVADDDSFDVLLRVLHVETGMARMRLYHVGFLDETKAAAAKETAAAEAESRAKHENKKKEFPCVDFKKATGWRLLGFDGMTVKQGLASEAAATIELEAYLKRSGVAKEKAA